MVISNTPFINGFSVFCSFMHSWMKIPLQIFFPKWYMFVGMCVRETERESVKCFFHSAWQKAAQRCPVSYQPSNTFLQHNHKKIFIIYALKDSALQGKEICQPFIKPVPDLQLFYDVLKYHFPCLHCVSLQTMYTTAGSFIINAVR